MDQTPAYRLAAGRFAVLDRDGARIVGLKAERQGKDHVNHFLLPLDPAPDLSALTLIYLDPEQALTPMDGLGLVFSPAEGGDVAVGEAVDAAGGQWIKVLDLPSSQRLYCYVNVVDGSVRSRMERAGCARLTWRLERI